MEILEQIKQIVVFYLNHWHTIDFISIIWIVVLFFLSILFVILLFEKMPIFSFLLFFISIGAVIGGFLYTKNYVDNALRARETAIVLNHKMNYSDALLVDVNLTNLSKNAFKFCKTSVKVIKTGAKFPRNVIDALKPIYEKNIVLNEPLNPAQTKKIHFLFTNFVCDGNYSLKANSECF